MALVILKAGEVLHVQLEGALCEFEIHHTSQQYPSTVEVRVSETNVEGSYERHETLYTRRPQRPRDVSSSPSGYTITGRLPEEPGRAEMAMDGSVDATGVNAAYYTTVTRPNFKKVPRPKTNDLPYVGYTENVAAIKFADPVLTRLAQSAFTWPLNTTVAATFLSTLFPALQLDTIVDSYQDLITFWVRHAGCLSYIKVRMAQHQMYDTQSGVEWMLAPGCSLRFVEHGIESSLSFVITAKAYQAGTTQVSTAATNTESAELTAVVDSRCTQDLRGIFNYPMSLKACRSLLGTILNRAEYNPNPTGASEQQTRFIINDNVVLTQDSLVSHLSNALGPFTLFAGCHVWTIGPESLVRVGRDSHGIFVEFVSLRLNMRQHPSPLTLEQRQQYQDRLPASFHGVTKFPLDVHQVRRFLDPEFNLGECLSNTDTHVQFQLLDTSVKCSLQGTAVTPYRNVYRVNDCVAIVVDTCPGREWFVNFSIKLPGL